MAILFGTHKADKINGTQQNDSIFGENGNDAIAGGAGDDHINGGNGSDMISGGAGNDVLDGGNGQDTAIYTGKRSDYRIIEGLNGAVVVRDLRSGSPDGQDRLFSIERIQFSDGTFKLADLIQSNVAPVAQNDVLTLAETAGKTEIGSILLANDSDADGDSLVVSSVQAVSAQGAAVSIGFDGKVSYDSGSIFADLDDGETATDSFTYTITDGQGHFSTATATVTITGVTQNAAPVAANDALTLSENAGKTDVTSILLANDSDPDGDPLVVSSVQGVSAQGATVSIGADGKVSYDPGAIFADLDDGETATDSFTYTISDGKGHVSTATATVTITGVSQNVAPVAGNDALTLTETAGKTDITSILLSNDSDADGDALIVSSVQAVSAQGATVSIGPDGKVSYNSGPIFYYLDHGHSATDSFTYTISDGKGHFSTATATVTIIGVNQNSVAPVALDDMFELDEDAGPTDITSILLSNDSDPDGDPFQINWVQPVSNMGATVTVGLDGKVTYDAGELFSYLEDGETATDSFEYEIYDADGRSGFATATVTINGFSSEVEGPGPHTSFTVNEDATKELLAGIVRRFDFGIADIDVTGTLGTVHFDPAQGVLSFTADHESSDWLNWDMHQMTSFTVIGTEGQRKVVGIRIQGNNDEIVAVDDHFAVGEGQTTGNLWDSMIANEIDPDSGPNSREILSVGTAGTQGVVIFDAETDTVTYSAAGIDLAPGETLVDSFTYTVKDDRGSVDTATVFVTVTGGPNGAASMAGGESIMAAFVGGAGGSHLDDSEFDAFPSMQPMQEMLVADAVIA